MRTISILSLGVFLLSMALVMLASCNKSNSFQESIIEKIDSCYGQCSEIQIKMTEITDFDWDKMLIFQAQTRRQYVNLALGISYDGALDLMEGIIFVHNGEVVFEDTQGIYVDRDARFRFAVNNRIRGRNYAVFTPDNAILYGRRLYRNNTVTYILSADPRE